jgi:hypothetical protein
MKDTKFSNSELYNLILSFTQKAFDYFIGLEEKDIPLISEYIWIKNEGGGYSRNIIDKIHYSALLHRSKRHLTRTLEYQLCLDFLSKDLNISAQIGRLVGTTLGQRRLEGEDVIFGCINKMLKANRSDVFEIDVFEEEYSKIEKAIYTNEIEYYDLIPLFGFSAEKNRIYMAKGLEIVKFSEDEILSFLNSGLIIGPPMLGGDHLFETATF